MDRKLQLLDSFDARGADGRHYKVMAYEHLVQPTPPIDGHEHWESTGRIEYRLSDGARVDQVGEGLLRVAGTGLDLRAESKV
jgi:hypothetical protein